VAVTDKGLLGFAAPGGRGAGGDSAPRTPSKPFGELNRGPRVGLYWVLLWEVVLNAGSGAEPAKVIGCQSGAARYGIGAGGVRRRGISVEARRLLPGQNAIVGQLDGVRAGAAGEAALAWLTMATAVDHEVSTYWGSAVFAGPTQRKRIRMPIPHCGQRRRSRPVSAR
jgi:hypothetical protein